MPHALGLLDAVKTYWVDEDHGDLPKNDDVLEAISDLLLRGETSKLAAKKPVTRGATRKPRPGRKTVEAVPAEAERILASAKRRRRADGGARSHTRGGGAAGGTRRRQLPRIG